jgi:regulator of protease activity HflC (stomatin/prohibitin superfamily)
MMGIAFLWPRIVITINSGEGGVLFQRFSGTVTDRVYTEGIHVIFPWNRMTVYNGRIQTVLHEFDVLTAQGLQIHLSLAIRFRPEYNMLGLLHQQVGPDYINSIITPEVESVVRKRLSSYNSQDIYMNKDKILTQMVVEAKEALGKKYISANDVIIRNISFPDSLRQAIESKLARQQEAESYVYLIQSAEHEAKRKAIDSEGIRNYQDTISKSISDKMLKWQGIQATLEMAKSPNSKVVVIGAGNTGMPLILGSEFSRDSDDTKRTLIEKSGAVKTHKALLPLVNNRAKPPNTPD